MGIEASIPLQTRVFKPKSGVESYGEAMKLKSLAGQQELQDMQMTQAKQAMGDKTKLRDLATASGGDYEKFLEGYGAIDPLGAMEASNKYAGQQTKAKSDELDLALKKNKSLYQILGSARDQTSYEAGINQALEMELITQEHVAQIPPQYNPEYVNQMAIQSLDLDKQLTMERDAENQKYKRGRDTKADELAASNLVYEKEQDKITNDRNAAADKAAEQALIYQKAKDAKAQGLVDEAKQYEFDYDESIVKGAIAKKERVNKTIDDLIDFIESSDRGRFDLPFGLQMAGKPNTATGLGAGVMSTIGGTDAKSVANQITSIQAIVGIDNLIDIKSKGGTFGALSDKELEVITAIFGSMDIGDPNLVDNLRKVKEGYGNISTDMNNLFKKKYSGREVAEDTTKLPDFSAVTQEDIDAELRRRGVIQ